MAGLRTGCLPLAVEVGRYTSTPLGQTLCQVCSGGLVEDQAHFLLYCPCLNIIRSNLFVYCNQINSKFISMSPLNKIHFLLNKNNKRVAHFLFKMYELRQSLLLPFNHPPLTSVTSMPILAGQFSDCHSNNHYYYYYYIHMEEMIPEFACTYKVLI